MLINSRCSCAGLCVVFDFDFVKKVQYPKLDKTTFGEKWAYNWNLFSDDDSTDTK